MIELPLSAAALLERLASAGYEAWVVGGCVRDRLLGRAPHDWDITTSALPEQLMALFSNAIPTGLTHGTVTVPTPDGAIEVTTYRMEVGYSDHRRPDAVRFLDTVDGDLARRDFTINAMAWHPVRGLRDPFDGQGSLTRREIRCVGDPDRRFAEDALRILRALRFAARFTFTIEPATAAAMRAHAAELRYVAAERIYTELCGLLNADGASLGEQYPEILTAATARLRLPESRHAMRTWRRQLGDANTAQLLHWCGTYGGLEVAAAQALQSQLLREERQPQLTIGGAELMALGIPPGPAMGRLQQRLRDAVLQGQVSNDPTALTDFVRQLLAENEV